MGWKQYGKEATEEREIGVPVRCRAVTVRANGVGTVWEGGCGGKRDRNSAQVSSGDGEGNGVETVWEGGYGGARDRNSGQVSSGDDEGIM